MLSKAGFRVDSGVGLWLRPAISRKQPGCFTVDLELQNRPQAAGLLTA
jgi:hypothetical protein